ncbi:Acetoin dehydrogenase operon transcriptional activator AcoR [Sporomusa silvacetica DSM 10669]|uniref:Acetoin dehydrogenase operon transcriptional activator AcoR n=1 Tax=Sporomusa silvacetica DSM 10669 TaxID=1123289 RepID=A0ABZ3ISB7_9FIRM|nr:sigma 54-interacting transcriptional regulator [Sporomusa silvacetica]OZC14532.1 acetoin dehydrogenase operon transcriptional activator AcoR [Sporomusa silvacetica DSM 10669]
MKLKDRWLEIQQSKLKFFKDNEDPRSSIHINPEVAESWIKSQAMGISPYTEIIAERLEPEQLEKLLKKEHLLIDVAKSVFEAVKLKDLMFASRYAIYLFDENGVLLLNEGDLLRLVPERNSMTGIVWNEKTMGTCAHILSMQLRRPVQLLGPEHYCVTFKNSNTSAAPIIDDNGDIIAIMVLSQHLMNEPLDDDVFVNLNSHALGLVTAMAADVENKLKLRRSYDQLQITNERLKMANYTLKVTLAVIDEGIITIDSTGEIIHINKEGSQMLGLEKGKTENRNIREFLNSQSRLMALIADGENADIEESLCVCNIEQNYMINIRVVNSTTGQVDGAVIKLVSAEKVNAMVNSRSGAIANYSFDDLIGESKEFKKAVALGKRFASSPENILLIGESGTGKELFAQAIHNKHRPNGPFVAVNCAALPRELIESELFGYEGGSFTGAERGGRPGKIELAHGGTLFLDEIGDMPLELQAVLLRVLEDKQVMRVGGRRYKRVDFRVVAATNKDLYQMIREKLFREDLYFRLSVLSINLPSLRLRENDVTLLGQYFIKKYCEKMVWEVPTIGPSARNIMSEYNWPGNVRQLENAVVYAVNTAQNQIIEAEDLPAIILNGEPAQTAAVGNIGEVYTIEILEKISIENVLYKTKNNITKAADLLGIGKSTLYRKLKEYNINVD